MHLNTHPHAGAGVSACIMSTRLGAFDRVCRDSAAMAILCAAMPRRSHCSAPLSAVHTPPALATSQR